MTIVDAKGVAAAEIRRSVNLWLTGKWTTEGLRNNVRAVLGVYADRVGEGRTQITVGIREQLRQRLTRDIFDIAQAEGTSEASVVAEGLLDRGWTHG